MFTFRELRKRDDVLQMQSVDLQHYKNIERKLNEVLENSGREKRKLEALVAEKETVGYLFRYVAIIYILDRTIRMSIYECRKQNVGEER